MILEHLKFKNNTYFSWTHVKTMLNLNSQVFVFALKSYKTLLKTQVDELHMQTALQTTSNSLSKRNSQGKFPLSDI